MLEGLKRKIRTFLNTREEWHYFWMGFFIASSLYTLILYLFMLFQL